MEKNRFKTTIKCSACLQKATPFLDQLAGAGNWQVDLSHPGRILEVPAHLTPGQVKEALHQAGYRAELCTEPPERQAS